ncbi:hypothetical protein HYV89_00870 [Candidatus Woesearchaeota archaeon]|nr:hypothetical protein [Candidatus Woesearchaeota archaeon]
MNEKGVISKANGGLANMISKSVFLKTFGDGPINKVLDFLTVFSDFDYSIADIAENSGVGYSTLKILIKGLEKRKIVIETRISGRNKMYKLNRNNPLVERFVQFYWDITNQKARELVKPMIA